LNDNTLAASNGLNSAQQLARQRAGWYAVAIFFLAYLISIIDRQLLSLLFVPIQTDLQLSDTAMSTLHGFTFALFYSVLGLPIARLIDGGNRRLIVGIGVLIWTIATAACGLATEFWHLLVARVFVAAGEATLLPGTCSMVADYFAPDRRGKAMSVFGIGGTLGNSFSMLAGGVLFAAFSDVQMSLPFVGLLQPWQSVFVVVAAPGIIVTALIFTIKDPGRKSSSEEKGVPFKSVVGYFKENRASYTYTIAGISLYFSAMLAYLAWTPTLLIRNHGMELSQAGKLYGLILLICGPLGTYFGGVFSDRLLRQGRSDGKVISCIIACIGMVIPGLLYPFMDNLTIMIALIGVFVFFSSAPLGTAPASIQDMTPAPMRGQAIALYTGILNVVGFGLGPLFVALLTDRVFGDPLMLKYSMLAVMAVSITLGVLFMIMALNPYRETVKNSQSWSAL